MIRFLVLACSCAVLIGPLSGQAPGPLVSGIELDDIALHERYATFGAAIESGDHRRAAVEAQRIIDDSLAPVAPEGGGWPVWRLIRDPHVDGLHAAADHHVARRVTSGGEGLIEAYRALVGERADRAARAARSVGDLPAQAHLARRYPVTGAGLRCREVLGLRALERGATGHALRLVADVIDLDPDASSERRARAATVERLHAETDAGIGSASLAGLATSRCRGDVAPVGRKTRIGWTRPLDDDGEAVEDDSWLVAPIVVGDRAIYHDAVGVHAIDLASGTDLWSRRFGAEGGPPALERDDLRDFRGALCGEVYLAVTAHRDPERGGAYRVLNAVSIEDGRILWRRDGRRLATGVPPLVFDTAPLTHEGMIFLTAFDRGSDTGCYALCFDAVSGRPVWITRLGTGLSLTYREARRGDRRRERWYGALPACLARGFLVCCTNLGHVVVLEHDSGRPRFLYSYPRRQVVSAGLTGSDSLVRGWDSNPILHHGDRFVVAPDDSDSLFGFFLRPPADGRRRRANLNFRLAAAVPRDGGRRLLGFDGKDAILTGWLDAEDVAVARREPLFVDGNGGAGCLHPLETEVRGSGIFVGNEVYVSSHKYVYCIDMEENGAVSVLHAREADGVERLGHVIPVDSGLLLVGRRAITRLVPDE